MNKTSTLNITGHLEIILTDALGNIKDKRSIPNLVVTAGKELIADRLLNATTSSSLYTVMSHMALGRSGATADASQTILTDQWGARQPLSSAPNAPSRTGNVITYKCTFGAGVPTTDSTEIREAGIFNKDAAGPTSTMLCRTTFGVITKGPLDILAINWNVTIG